MDDRRLIEDYLPLDALNAISAKEKKHPKHPVALVHYWPARRPTTASRAAVYAALVPAPRSGDERQDAASFVTGLAAFKPDPEVVEEAGDRIRKAHGGRTPKVLDLFAGGGAIPLEAARLGCESHALDYNPVAHLIELCTLVYPQTFGPKLADDFEHWSGVVLERMRAEVGDLYPAVQVPATEDVTKQAELFGGDGDPPPTVGQADPVACIWVRTVPCRRPGCTAPVPLVRQAWLRRKGGVVAAVPEIEDGDRLGWRIVSGAAARDISGQEAQTGAGQAVCVACHAPAPADHVKEMAVAGRMKESLAAVVVDGQRSKLYLPATVTILPDLTAHKDQLATSGQRKPGHGPCESLSFPRKRESTIRLPDDGECLRRLGALLEETGLDPLDEQMNTADSTTVAGRGYGISLWRELFTPRQLLVLFTLIKHIRNAHAEMRDAGMAADRARALATWFAMAFGRFVIAFNKFARWEPSVQITLGAIGDRQALKMLYDFSEINCFENTAGCLPFALDREAYCIRELAKVGNPSTVTRGNAEKLFYDDETFDAVITDPPYYSSIYYADLSAFFYVWLKRLVGDLYPEHFTLPAPPKRREAVAQPSEHGGDTKKATAHYQDMMRRSFAEARRVLKPGAPLVCVYAHRTTEGWATLIRALIDAGLTVTEAWPVQTESRGRVNALGAAALSDSIFFAARRREAAENGQYETEVEPELHRIARERVATLWAGGKGIGGADLLMAAVGAGLRAYTRFARVEYANGEVMLAERYLREVEGVVLDVMLDEIFGLRGAAVASVDPLTRFYILWRFTYRESPIEAGDAYVFCYPQGIEMDGPDGIAGPPPALAEKIRAGAGGSKFRVRTFEERGGDDEMGIGEDGRPAPLVDVVHRLLWLLDNRPVQVREFLEAARPSSEQLRLVTQALCAPVLGRPEAQDATPTAELRALARLNANWRGIVEGAAYDREVEERVTGQPELPLEGDHR